jgi:hypothetical protein
VETRGRSRWLWWLQVLLMRGALAAVKVMVGRRRAVGVQD